MLEVSLAWVTALVPLQRKVQMQRSGKDFEMVLQYCIRSYGKKGKD